MRTTWLLTLTGLLLFPFLLSSQTITGVVRDANTGEPLHHANVTLSPGGYGAATGENGGYTFTSVPNGTYTVQISFIGYEPHSEQISVQSADLRLSHALQPKTLPGPEIEVSAIKARERFSPVTFTDIEAEEIDRRYMLKDMPVMLADLPSITYYSESGHGIGYNYIRLRGFDQRRLAIMINGVPQNDPEDHNTYWSNFADLLGSTEEIQVQRGGGSAFYGPPAIGGSINIVTGDFANREGIRLSTGYGSYNTRKYAIGIGSGLIEDKYVVYGRLSQFNTDGYRDHSYVDKFTYYVAATRYDENFTTRLNFYGGQIEDGLVYYGLPSIAIDDRDLRRENLNYWETDEDGYTFKLPRRPQEREQFNQPHYELLNEWKINDALTMNSVLFHVRGYGYFDFDGTGWTNKEYYRLTDEFGFPNAVDPGNPLIHAYVDNRQWGWLPRVTWDHGGGTLTAGLELRTHNSLHYGTILFADDLPENYDPDRRFYEYSGAKDIFSGYVQELYEISPALNAMASVQVAYKQYRLFDEKYVGTDLSTDYLFFIPRVGLNYNLTPEWNIYTSLAYTQREPRLSTLYDAGNSSFGEVPQYAQNAAGGYDFDSPLVEPEKLTNLELGAGYNTANLKVLGNLYVMDFTDEIVKNGQVDQFGVPITGNADQTLHIGAEGTVVWRVLPELEFSANAMLSRSRLEEYTVFEEDTAISLDGNRIAGFPEQLVNARVTWHKFGLSASLSWKYVGDQYTDNFQNDDHRVEPYTNLDMIVGYRIPDVFGLKAIELRGAVYNVLDDLYATSGEGGAFFVAAERNYMFDVAFDL
ncbi:MAG: TonB-dependent receptor [Ectothiorhodospiraceae bacterium]|nr:TonB-dependent receptor [Ectothiorhodospiraceae bacterium]